MVLSLDEIYSVARSVGFPRETAAKMVAIAIKESAGNPQAHNSKPPDDSYGLWQINMIGALGPDRRGRLGLSSNSQLFDPVVNARAAKMIWAGNDSNLARHWYINLDGYNANKFNEVLPLARAAADRVDGVAPGPVVPAPAPGSIPAPPAPGSVLPEPETIPADGETPAPGGETPALEPETIPADGETPAELRPAPLSVAVMVGLAAVGLAALLLLFED